LNNYCLAALNRVSFFLKYFNLIFLLLLRANGSFIISIFGPFKGGRRKVAPAGRQPLVIITELTMAAAARKAKARKRRRLQ
jgi:hypothetical protein